MALPLLIAIAALISVASAAEGETCTYQYKTTAERYYTASQKCEELGGHLAKWTNQAEFDQINQLATTKTWTSLWNPDWRYCLNAGCAGKLEWRHDDTEYDHPVAAEQIKAVSDKRCVFFENGKTDGEECSKKFAYICQFGCNESELQAFCTVLTGK